MDDFEKASNDEKVKMILKLQEENQLLREILYLRIKESTTTAMARACAQSNLGRTGSQSSNRSCHGQRTNKYVTLFGSYVKNVLFVI